MSDLDLTPEAVERLACEAELFGYNRQASTLRALSDRLDIAEQGRAKEWQRAQGAEERNRRLQAKLKAAEAALATARADAALIEELVAAGNVMANALRGDYIVPGSAGKWFAALAKMNGAQP
jgi:hypothetical protein